MTADVRASLAAFFCFEGRLPFEVDGWLMSQGDVLQRDTCIATWHAAKRRTSDIAVLIL